MFAVVVFVGGSFVAVLVVGGVLVSCVSCICEFARRVEMPLVVAIDSSRSLFFWWVSTDDVRAREGQKQIQPKHWRHVRRHSFG